MLGRWAGFTGSSEIVAVAGREAAPPASCGGLLGGSDGRFCPAPSASESGESLKGAVGLLGAALSALTLTPAFARSPASCCGEYSPGPKEAWCAIAFW